MPHEDLTKLSFDELMTRTGVPGSQQNVWIELEFGRRQTVAQQQAAKAAEETAVYTQRNALYMLLSVIVLTASSVATFVLAVMRCIDALREDYAAPVSPNRSLDCARASRATVRLIDERAS
jgi:hypothetical protein